MQLTESKMFAVLNWAYDKALEGPAGLDSASDLANSYQKEDAGTLEQVNSLIRWQNTKAATSGFVTGLGGLITLPVAVPANISSVLFVQVRMIAAIAIMGCHDVRDDQVKALVFLCLVGRGANEILKATGVKVGEKLTVALIKKVPAKVLVAINRKVGFRLLTKFGEKGVVNLAKVVPVVGGVVGATFDAVSTNIVGNAARKIFIEPERD